MLYFVLVSSFTAYITVTFMVRLVRVNVSVKVRVSVRLPCHLANKVSVRCVYRAGE